MAQIKKKRNILMDCLYDNVLVYKLINRVLKSGKKTLAYKIVHLSMLQLKEITKQDPIQILETAIKNVSPTVEVKSKRVGGTVNQVPVKVSRQRAQTLAIRWILNEARAKSRKSIVFNLTNSILEASKGSGQAIRRKEEIHRVAESNRMNI